MPFSNVSIALGNSRAILLSSLLPASQTPEISPPSWIPLRRYSVQVHPVNFNKGLGQSGAAPTANTRALTAGERSNSKLPSRVCFIKPLCPASPSLSRRCMCSTFPRGRPPDRPPQGSQGGEIGQLSSSDVFAARASVYLAGGPGSGVASQSYFKLKQRPALLSSLVNQRLDWKETQLGVTRLRPTAGTRQRRSWEPSTARAPRPGRIFWGVQGTATATPLWTFLMPRTISFPS